MSATAQLNVTPDGFCNHDNVAIDDDFMRFAVDCILASDCLLLGRKTYQLFADHWPQAARNQTLPEWERKLGKAIDETPRIVASESLAESDWEGTSFCLRLDRDAAKSMCVTRDVLILGSPSIISQFAHWGLLDRLYLSVHPLMGRTGMRLFAASAPAAMQFVRSFQTGAEVKTFEFALKV